MLVQEILDLYQVMDRPGRVAEAVAELFAAAGTELQITTVTGDKGSTDFVKVRIAGAGVGPTLGVIGRLGGIGARPEQIGFVSDGDGALSALAVGLRLARMRQNGDFLGGDVIVTTHLCTDAPTEPHDPVPFMDSPVEIATMNEYEVDGEMSAILSIDTSRGNRICNRNGFAISPTVKEGWILRVSEGLLDVMQQVTGSLPMVLPITMPDITPYGNNLYHFNSIMQPATSTASPVVGVAITSEVPVAGCATGVTNLTQLDQVGRFVIEAAQSYGSGKLEFYDPSDWEVCQKRYGKMTHLQTLGRKK